MSNCFYYWLLIVLMYHCCQYCWQRVFHTHRRAIRQRVHRTTLPSTWQQNLLIVCLSNRNFKKTIQAKDKMNDQFKPCFVIKLQARAMLIAVSTLSPVNTHNRMPASAKSEMHSGTPDCSRSSMAVAPSKLKRCSTSSATLRSFTRRCDTASVACVHFLSHSDAARGDMRR